MSSPNFTAFASAVSKKLSEIYNHGDKKVFVVEAERDELFEVYLGAFPEGTNPIYRKRTVYDGSYDRAFIRRVGGVVAITPDLELDTIWDVEGLEYPFDIVAKALSEHIREKAIQSRFYTPESTAGHLPNVEVLEDGREIDYNHFYTKVGRPFVTDTAPAEIGSHRNDLTGFKNALELYTSSAIDTVLSLINDRALYRGDQYKWVVTEMSKLHAEYNRINNPVTRNRWLFSQTSPLKIRGSAIGALLEDLSRGTPLTDAVNRYGVMVDPVNYRHTTSVVSQAMIERAMATIAELGLEPALERRSATIEDISVNDVLWADADASSQMKGGLKDLLLKSIPETKRVGESTAIDIKDFMSNVLPSSTALEIFMSSNMQNRLVTLVAPVHGDLTTKLFAWDNNFSWSYNGNVTDTIVERVRAAGGKVDGKLRVSLAWSNTDDLDLHAVLPDNSQVNYRFPRGVLDVDANSPTSVKTSTPVENMNFPVLMDGIYSFTVANYESRNTDHKGYDLQVAYGGEVHDFHSRVSPGTGEYGRAVTVKVRGGTVVEVQSASAKLVASKQSSDVWGVNTERFVPVSTVMFSPNYWRDAGDSEFDNAGNRHYFFMLKGCATTSETRGIYNEYLRNDLREHRKVFDLIGNKTLFTPGAYQLSGLGFSSTLPGEFKARVTKDGQVRDYVVSV